MNYTCPECGFPLRNGQTPCPECGCPIEYPKNVEETPTEYSTKELTPGTDQDSYKTVSELFWNCQFYKVFKGKQFDFGQRIYELGVMWWEMVIIWWRVFTKRFANFQGRASRREYFSYIGLGLPFVTPFMAIGYLPIIILMIFGYVGDLGPYGFASLFGIGLLIGIIIVIIPVLAVSVRRMHDINKSGWWVLCPIASFFLLFRKSDEGENDYGEPFPGKRILDNEFD